ncbi:MAG: MFS transporter [Hyphomonadaceae bacterium]
MAEPAQGAISIPLRTKIMFALGSAAENVALTGVGSFALFFYNQVLGMPATMAGMAISLGILLDGLADPLIGSISDRTRGKWGRRHPYMFAAPIPIAISFIAIFNPPEALSGIWLFAWFTIFCISLRVCMAVYHTPHLALAGEMSRDFVERSRLLSWNVLFQLLSTSITTFAAYTLFFHKTPEYPKGLLNPEAYSPFGFVLAGVTLVLLFASAWFTRDRIPTLHKIADDLPKFSPFEFFKDIGAAMSNMNYVYLLVGYFFISMASGLTVGLAIYINTYFWQLSSEQLRWFALGSITGFYIGFLITPWFHRRFGKRLAMAICVFGLAVIPAVPVALGLMGVLPRGNDPLILPVLIFATGLNSIVSCGIFISTGSALGDIADENELRVGRRQEGVLYATRTLFAKIDLAVGQLLAGLALDIVHFPKNATPGHVDYDIITHLAWIGGIVAVAPGLISVFFYAQYKIDQKTFEETRRKLAERHPAQSKTEAPEPATGGGA